MFTKANKRLCSTNGSHCVRLVPLRSSMPHSSLLVLWPWFDVSVAHVVQMDSVLFLVVPQDFFWKYFLVTIYQEKMSTGGDGKSVKLQVLQIITSFLMLKPFLEIRIYFWNNFKRHWCTFMCCSGYTRDHYVGIQFSYVPTLVIWFV